MVREDQRPHPWTSYRSGVGLEDASHDHAVAEHVEVIGITRRGLGT
jgi:hypothetical protein